MLSMAADLEATGNLRRTPNPRVLIEMLLLRMSYLERTARIEDLLEGIGGGPRGGVTGSRPAPEPAARSRAQDPVHVSPRPGHSPPLRRAIGPRVHRCRKRHPPPVQDPSPTAAAAGGSAGRSRPTGQTLAPAEAWETFLQHRGSGVPPGLGPFLRSAEVGAGGGAVGSLIELPDGPGFERMTKPAVQAAVSAGLAEHLGYAPVRVRRPEVLTGPKDGTGGTCGRRSDGANPVRQRVSAGHPGDRSRDPAQGARWTGNHVLEQAVKELDLELMD